MRKITEKAATALKNGLKMTSGNTAVTIAPYANDERYGVDSATMTLHGNDIACYALNGYDLLISDCGWQSATTKERLNGILDALDLPYYIAQRDYTWFIFDRNTHKALLRWSGQAYFSCKVHSDVMVLDMIKEIA